MKKEAFFFERKIRTKVRRNNVHKNCNIFLIYDHEYFNPNIATDSAKVIQNEIQDKYFRFFNKIPGNGLLILAKIGGLHFNIFDIQKYLIFNDKRTNVILHYNSWPINMSGAYDEDSVALINCDKALFESLLKEFWFALGFEVHFEVILIKPDVIFKLESWVKRKDSSKKQAELLKMSEVVFDNLTNGFHFRITAKENYFDQIPFNELGNVFTAQSK